MGKAGGKRKVDSKSESKSENLQLAERVLQCQSISFSLEGFSPQLVSVAKQYSAAQDLPVETTILSLLACTAYAAGPMTVEINSKWKEPILLWIVCANEYVSDTIEPFRPLVCAINQACSIQPLTSG
jgi:hypothetical protein